MLGTMLRFVRVVNRRFRDGAGMGLTLTDLSVLTQIERGVELPSTVADRLYLDRPRVSRIANRLVADGYLERHPDPRDRRRSRLTLTESGVELLNRGRNEVARATDDVLQGLPPQERAVLVESLESLRPLLEESSEKV